MQTISTSFRYPTGYGLRAFLIFCAQKAGRLIDHRCTMIGNVAAIPSGVCPSLFAVERGRSMVKTAARFPRYVGVSPLSSFSAAAYYARP